jgi:guanylate kinase
VIERRLHQAKRELEQVWDYRYALINDVLDEATAELRAIVLHERGVSDGVAATAETCRTDRKSQRLCEVLRRFGIEC